MNVWVGSIALLPRTLLSKPIITEPMLDSLDGLLGIQAAETNWEPFHAYACVRKTDV